MLYNARNLMFGFVVLAALHMGCTNNLDNPFEKAPPAEESMSNGETEGCTDNSDCAPGVCCDGMCQLSSCEALASCSDGILNSDESDLDCGGLVCSRCLDGQLCSVGSDCTSGVCEEGICQDPTCSDEAFNGDETDIDCGGDTCEVCTAGQNCNANTDCQSGFCGDNICNPPLCDDEARNGDETDVDCGGFECSGCTEGQACTTNTDCQSRYCEDNICAPPSCDDGVWSIRETDVDCGGPNCPACADGLECDTNMDCMSEVCEDGVCQAADCDDRLLNGSETDVDCGGSECSPCRTGKDCALNSDCSSELCAEGLCTGIATSCDDNTLNENETDTDCGGNDCPNCGDGRRCVADSDCQSDVCEDEVCQAADCSDATLNGNETDTDCGGTTCPVCSAGQACEAGTDCLSGVCQDGVCTSAGCEDAQLNGSETDIDCGGTICAPCFSGEACLIGDDCRSLRCGASNICIASSCNDTIFNGEETDEDCGGPTCPVCADGLMCNADSDCFSGTCEDGACRPPLCDDEQFNGDETDLDCGGPLCAPCADNLRCVSNTDCLSSLCNDGICQGPTCDDMLQNGDEDGVDCGGSCLQSCPLGISINPEMLELSPGLIVNFQAQLNFADGSAQDVTSDTQWNSSNRDAMVVSNGAQSRGRGTAVGLGEAVITAMFDEFQVETTVSVIDPVVRIYGDGDRSAVNNRQPVVCGGGNWCNDIDPLVLPLPQGTPASNFPLSPQDTIGRLELYNNARVIINGDVTINHVVIEGGSTLVLNHEEDFVSFELTNGVLTADCFTHNWNGSAWDPAAGAGNGKLFINAEQMTIGAQGTITMDVCGYQGASTSEQSGASVVGPSIFGGGPNSGGGGAGMGAFVSGGGAGYAFPGTNSMNNGPLGEETPGEGGTAYGALDYWLEMYLGSGGGTATGIDAMEHQIGGDGGGAIRIVATSLLNQGIIRANGNNGYGARGGAAQGGGGSGGTIYISAPTFDNTLGTIEATGGLWASDGRIGLDTPEENIGNITPSIACRAFAGYPRCESE